MSRKLWWGDETIAKRDFKPKPLYRRVNTRTHGVRHGNGHGGEYRWQRNSKQEKMMPDASMHSGLRLGLDYTPLFRFLVSRVGGQWDEIYSEAVQRLDKPEPIFWLVSVSGMGDEPVIRTGESSYFSGLFVDPEGRLQMIDSDLSAKTMEPYCHCCTHTFNGEVFGIKKTLDDFKEEWSNA